MTAKLQLFRTSLLFIVFGGVTCVFGQNGGSSTIDQYLDDGGRTIAQNLLKTDISEVLTGNIPICWEHKFNSNFTLEGSVGLLTNCIYNPVISPPQFFGCKIYNSLKPGYSLYVFPKQYFQALESSYSGICFKLHHYVGQAYSTEFDLLFGKQWLLGGYWVVDLGFGLGFNFETSVDGVSYIYNPKAVEKNQYGSFSTFRPSIPVILKIGYRI
jgi:hypothetical protein